MHDHIASIAGGEQDFQTRPSPHRFVRKLAAIDAAGHHHVGKEQIDIVAAVENFESGDTAVADSTR